MSCQVTPATQNACCLPAFCWCCSLPRHGKHVADMYSLKHPRWWVQSYLAGVPTLVLGGRDGGGSLVKVRVSGRARPACPVHCLPEACLIPCAQSVHLLAV